ncbi:MAG: hypothetical protein QXL15_04390 [Candidatus Korarchaeota archaeon]
MGRRRKRRRIIPQKQKIEYKILECPECGSRTLGIEMKYKEGIAYVSCGECQLFKKIKISQIDTRKDVLAYLIDILEDESKGKTNPRDLTTAENVPVEKENMQSEKISKKHETLKSEGSENDFGDESSENN